MDQQPVSRHQENGAEQDHAATFQMSSKSGPGRSFPPPAFQLSANAPIQASKDKGKRERETEPENAAKEAPVQRVLNAQTPIGSRIVIDGNAKGDQGDVGTIVRLSRNRANCFAVRFDNEPLVLYRVYYNEATVYNDRAPVQEEDEPDNGILNGGDYCTRMNIAAFWQYWDPQQRDNNIHEPAVARYMANLRSGIDRDAPFMDSANVGTNGLIIRTSDGRHRITAARRLGRNTIQVIQPSAQFLQMLEIAGVNKTDIFPDL